MLIVMRLCRRTQRSLADIISFITKLKAGQEAEFSLSRRQGFKWWWAFTKKHNIISLYYQEPGDREAATEPLGNQAKQQSRPKAAAVARAERVSSPEQLLAMMGSPASVPINIPTSSLLPFLGLASHSKYSLQHPDFSIPTNSAPTSAI